MHTLFSDGVLLPAELARRCEVKGFRGLAMTDHVDQSNIDLVVPRLVEAAQKLSSAMSLKVCAGVELTHVRLEHFKELVQRSRAMGAQIVLAHGETLVEPVIPGTNRAAIEAGVDVLAHPGLISKADVRLAVRKGVRLEISGRKGHSLTNGHVARLATLVQARLTFGSDTHSPEDILDQACAERIAQGAGLGEQQVAAMFAECTELIG
jgi:histidinol phosphatase-like PHP family hydrolase